MARLAVTAPVLPSSSQRILSTALDLFAVKGYDATSVREICEAAAITKPTLYHFFGSKDGVLQALMTSGFARFWRCMHGIVWAPPATVTTPVNCSEFYDGVVGAMAAAHDEAVRMGELSAG